MLLKDVDFTRIVPDGKRLLRSGVIPFVRHRGKKFFLMGVDAKHNEWSDFGGGVKGDENALSGGMRECLEELRWIISFQDLGIITSAIYQEKEKQKMCIMFSEITIPGFYHNAKKMFHDKTWPDAKHEMKDIIWLSEEQLLKKSRLTNKSSKIWKRVRSAMSQCGSLNRDFIDSL